MERMLEDTVTRLFRDLGKDSAALWSGLEETGMTRLWVSEAEGGFDLSVTDGFGLIRLAGAHAIAVPVVETLLASRFLKEAGIGVPEVPASLFLEGHQRAVPFGNVVEHVVRLRGRSVSLCQGRAQDVLDVVGADICTSISGFDEVIDEGEMPHDVGLLFAALARSVQICGALDTVLNLTIDFAGQREQFGRPLSKFQAIQHMLSEMGSEAAAASAAVDAAVLQADINEVPDRMSIAAAKYRAGMAAGTVAKHAHQIHGAIGYTEEYELAGYTRRLWQWREDFGGEAYWAAELGRAALSAPEPLWPRLTEASLMA